MACVLAQQKQLSSNPNSLLIVVSEEASYITGVINTQATVANTVTELLMFVREQKEDPATERHNGLLRHAASRRQVIHGDMMSS